jgi:hypothetical protein
MGFAASFRRRESIVPDTEVLVLFREEGEGGGGTLKESRVGREAGGNAEEGSSETRISAGESRR